MKRFTVAFFVFFGLILPIYWSSGINVSGKKIDSKGKSRELRKSPSPKKPLVAYLKDGKWHFLDTAGKLLFSPIELLDVLGYSEGYFRVNIEVNKKPKWALIDLAGNITVIDRINYLFNFHNGRALVVKLKNADTTNQDFLFGYINYQGRLAIPLIYEDATDFSEGLAFVKNNEIRGFIDTSNNLVIKMENAAANKFKDGLADINDRRYKVGFMNRNGEIVVPLEFDILDHFYEGLAFAVKGDTAGFINKEGKYEFYVDAYTAKPFSDSLAFVGKLIQRKMKWCLINNKGEKVTDYIFDDVKEFSEGVAPVLKDGRWYFIDKNGVEVIPNDYLYVDKFVDGLAWVSLRNGKRGYINHSGKIVVEVPDADKYFDLRLNRRIF
ncbi:MAG: WG repeat-containing protein [Candidatus Kapaibacteriota bacterium]